MGQIEGLVEHSSGRATQEEADKPYLETRALSMKCTPAPSKGVFLEGRS